MTQDEALAAIEAVVVDGDMRLEARAVAVSAIEVLRSENERLHGENDELRLRLLDYQHAAKMDRTLDGGPVVYEVAPDA